MEEQEQQPQVVAEKTVAKAETAPTSVVLQRVVWYVLGAVVALLVVRFVLLLMGANEGNGFVDFVYSLSGVFASPFYGIFSYEPSYGKSVFEVSTLVAIAVYTLVAWGLGKVFTIASNRA